MNGQDLKARRLSLHLSRRQLANLLGETEDKIYLWETDRYSITPFIEAAFEQVEAKLGQRQSALTRRRSILTKINKPFFAGD